MAAKKGTYYGANCTGDCGGHRAGYRYAKGGGRALTRSSASFNSGMRIAQRHLKNQGVKSRMGVTKRSK